MAFYTSTHRSVSRDLFEAKIQAAEFVASGYFGRASRAYIHTFYRARCGRHPPIAPILRRLSTPLPEGSPSERGSGRKSAGMIKKL